MTIKTVLYILTTPLALYALDACNYEKFIKANHITQARILFLMLALSLSYFTTNFIFDFFVNTQLL